MLDAPTDRTGVTSAALPRARQYDAEEGPERRSVAGPFRPWLIASYVINVLPLKTKVKHGVPCSPSRNRPFELEITFCVRGVMTPPCGVPCFARLHFSRLLPPFPGVLSFSTTGVCSHIRISFSTDRSATRYRTQACNLSCGIESKYPFMSARYTASYA